MKVQDLLKMDTGEAIDWLINNQYDFELLDKKEFIDLFSDCHTLAKDTSNWKLVDKIDGVITKIRLNQRG